MSHDAFIQPGFEKALAHVVEEAGEVLAAVGKTQRFGPLSVNPLLPPEEQEMNLFWLLRELEDLKSAIGRLEHECLLEHGELIRRASPAWVKHFQRTDAKRGRSGRLGSRLPEQSASAPGAGG